MKNIDVRNVNTIRILAAEAIQSANSGHPGLPLGAAELSYALFNRVMKHNPSNSKWENRDRFVLSAGHGSGLLYSLLHLYGYKLSIDDLKNFRQLSSLTPGHPEYAHTDGVEVTTGPLGQGVANAVGMAIAETKLADKFNKEGLNIVDHYTYVLAGDGCMMEGVSSEASSLAGTLGLNKLVLLYDSNNITIEGNTDIAFREDVMKRYEAYGWQTIKVEDGTNIDTIEKALNEAKAEKTKPSFIEIKTVIGQSCKAVEGTAGAHGSPLGDANIKEMRENFGFSNEAFTVESDVAEYYASQKEEFAKNEASWNELVNEYKEKYPAEYAEYVKWMTNDFDLSFIDGLYDTVTGDQASRASSGKVLNEVAKTISNMIGGSADLAPSNKSYMNGLGDYSNEDRLGMNLHFGVREFGMGAVANGIYLHGGFNVYTSTFFVFSDYMKPAMRMASLMELPMTYILTHDSIGVGEDGPTHQPIEHLAMLRTLPNFNVIRPADTTEVVAAWKAAMTSEKTPTALILSRQGLPSLENTSDEAMKGAYALNKVENPDVLLMASGSEVSLVVEASKELAKDGIIAKVISMPSFELFENQSDEYKKQVLDESAKYRFAVEAAASSPWYKYIAGKGDVLGIDRFGMSAPAGQIFEQLGFTVENIVAQVKGLMK